MRECSAVGCRPDIAGRGLRRLENLGPLLVQLHVAAAVGRRDRQTDGRTDGRTPYRACVLNIDIKETGVNLGRRSLQPSSPIY